MVSWRIFNINCIHYIYVLTFIFKGTYDLLQTSSTSFMQYSFARVQKQLKQVKSK